MCKVPHTSVTLQKQEMLCGCVGTKGTRTQTQFSKHCRACENNSISPDYLIVLCVHKAFLLS